MTQNALIIYLVGTSAIIIIYFLNVSCQTGNISQEKRKKHFTEDFTCTVLEL